MFFEHEVDNDKGFLTFTVGKTQFRGLCLLPLSRALGQLSKYEIKKGGHFILRQSLKEYEASIRKRAHLKNMKLKKSKLKV